VVVREMDGFRYEYHIVTGSECLIDLGDRSRIVHNVLQEHPAIAAACRKALEAELGVDDLQELRTSHAETIRRLQSLGYL
jgi:hypothetical protein